MVMEIFIESVKDILSNLDIYITTFIAGLGVWGTVLSCLLILIESIIPVLPLCVFITLLFISFGNIVGFIISWLFTCIGCLLSFSLCRYLFQDWFERKLKETKKDREFFKKLKRRIDNMKLSSLAVLVAIPFTPAFLVNIVSGISKMSTKKFITAILIGKLFMVYFWGYLGTTLIECLTHPIYLLKVLIMLLISYVASKIINRYLKLE